jgi:hypothetical protein
MKKKKGRKEKKPTIQYNRGNKYAVNKKRGLQDCKMGEEASRQWNAAKKRQLEVMCHHGRCRKV